MKKTFIFCSLVLFFSSCILFESKEEKAIKICQESKVQFQSDNNFLNGFLSLYGLETNATWLDYANMVAKKEPNIKYEWNAKKTDDESIYIVCFADTTGWGHHWEVDINQKIIKSINENEYLSRKYGLSKLSDNSEFDISNVEISKLEKIENNYSNKSSLVYIIHAYVLNKTDKTITTANINGELKLIFKDKTISVQGSLFNSGFKESISEYNPWEPDTEKEFYIKTTEISDIYLNYTPEYVVFDISLNVSDPIGYTFNKDISEIDLKTEWNSYNKGKTPNNPKQDLLDGINLLFKNVKTKLTFTEKTTIYNLLEFGFSKDKNQFFIKESCGDSDMPDETFDASVEIIDLNSDGNEEIIITYGNLCTSGNAGNSTALFIKDKNGKYFENYNSSGLTYILPLETNGYKDLVIGGPGFEFPVYTWNGKEYEYTRDISNDELIKLTE